MKSTPLTDHTVEDADKYIGSTIVQTISNDPLMQRVGIVIDMRDTELLSKNHGNRAADIYWQPCPSMPFGRPYRSLHIVKTLKEHYFIFKT
jgi:hypothetical protein